MWPFHKREILTLERAAQLRAEVVGRLEEEDAKDKAAIEEYWALPNAKFVEVMVRNTSSSEAYPGKRIDWDAFSAWRKETGK